VSGVIYISGSFIRSILTLGRVNIIDYTYLKRATPMSETVADELGALRWGPTSALAVPDASDHWQAAPTLGFSELPVIRRGQLWFVELPESGPGLAPFEYGGLTTANIVVYDRALAPTVARHLPLGSYAEPATSSDGRTGVA